jgi:ADP-ribose pyrophosphatase YjhB (NUDIX family)
MTPWELFAFCPRCGSKRSGPAGAVPFRCNACGLVYFFNPASAVGAILFGPDDRALFLKRAHDPGQGKLGLPGGFVDLGETAEEALRREVREEVNLELSALEFLCSCPNVYPYAGVTYSVLDLYFVARVASVQGIAALDGVESYCWLRPEEVDLEALAFTSARQALQFYQSQNT